MIVGGIPLLLAGTKPIPLLSFLQAATPIEALATTHVFPAENFGVATTDRRIIIGVAWGSTDAISSCTIGGVTATIKSQAAGGTGRSAAILMADVPTGTSGDVSITFAADVARVALHLWRLTFLLDSAVFDAASSNAGEPFSLSLNIPVNGVALAIAGCTATSGTTTWTGLTEVADQDLPTSGVVSSASGDFASAITGLAIDANFSVSGNGAIAAVSFGN